MTREGARHAVAQFPPPRGTPNPYHELLYATLAEHGLPRLPLPRLNARALWRQRRTIRFLHFHWCLDRFYAPCLYRAMDAGPWRNALALLQVARFALRLAFAQRLGYQLVWTVHEVRPPRRSGLSRRIDRVAHRLLARRCRVLLAHDAAVADQLRAELGRPLAIQIVPHGTFRDAYPAGRPPGEVRAEFGIPANAFVFLCFGHLRIDKQLGLLLDAFALIDSPEICLVVAGKPADPAACARVERSAASDGRLRAILHEVPKDQVAELFGIADAFVLARGEPAWTSGSLVLALSLGVPAVAARVAPVTRLLGDEVGGWLFTPGDPDSLALAMRRAAGDPASALAKRVAARELGDALPEWEEVACATAQLLA